MPTMERPATHRADRLRRAWKLVASGRVERVGPGQFKVAGNVEPVYYVDLAGDQCCTCCDMEYRGRAINEQCKHVLAARLANHDPELLLTLVSMMQFTDTED